MYYIYRVYYKRKMTVDSSTASHLSIAKTTDEDYRMPITDGDNLMSSPLINFELYFRWAVVAIGVVGTAANGFVLYALVASKQHKKHLLIVNQNVLDVFSSFFLAVTYSLKLCDLHLTGALGYWLCVMLLSENLIWWGTNGSIINLASITIDRYLKVVHHVWSKKWLRPPVIYSAMAFAWLAGIVLNTAVSFATSEVVDGACYIAVLVENSVDRVVSVIWYVLSFYVVILIIFISCYSRILITIRRQARVMAVHGSAGAGPSTSSSQSNRFKYNVIKTMIIVSAFYAISWMPIYLYHLYLMVDPNESFLDGRYYASVFAAFFYICANPFIYATKLDPVKKILRDMISCKKIPNQSTGGPDANRINMKRIG